MTVYMTETEQWEAIKKWWQRHGHRISVALSVILLIVTGYQYWNWHQDKTISPYPSPLILQHTTFWLCPD